MAGLSSPLTAIGGSLAVPSQTAVRKLDVRLGTWCALADACAVKKSLGPVLRQEVLRAACLT